MLGKKNVDNRIEAIKKFKFYFIVVAEHTEHMCVV